MSPPDVPRRIYLDHAATTPVRPEVRAAMEPFLAERFGNASSLHAEGQAARASLEEARAQIRETSRASDFDFAFEAPALSFVGVSSFEHDLEGHGALGGQFPGFVVASHATAAEFGLHVVARNLAR